MASMDAFEDHCWIDIVPSKDLDVYKSSARRTRVGARPALLAIDLWNVVYRGGHGLPHELDDKYPSTCGIYAHSAIEPTKSLFTAARAAGIPVFYSTKDVNVRSTPRGVSTTKRNRVKERKPDDHEIYHAFAPMEGDTIIYKQRASAFSGTPLLSHLVTFGARSLIICGESTSGCVRASAVDAFSNGFHVSVVEECCFDRIEISHKINLFDLHHKYADVMHVDEVVAHLNGVARESERALREK